MAAVGGRGASDGGEEQNLWQNMLKEATREGKTQSSHLVVLGSPSSGKTRLMEQFKQLTASAPTRGASSAPDSVGCVRASLRYTYFNKVAPQEKASVDVDGVMDVWMLSTLEHKSLLSIAFDACNLAHTAMLLVLDLSKPWTIAKDLEEWGAAIEEAAGAAVGATDMATSDALKEAVRKAVTTYASSTTAGVGDDVELPLADGVLTVNLGIPLVIVCCKADLIKGEGGSAGASMMSHLRYFSDSKWDLLQAYIRKFALKYGAAVCYTSSVSDTNTSTLLSYLLHRTDPQTYRTRSEPLVLDRDAVFVPSGFDSHDLLQDLLDSSTRSGLEDAAALAALIPPPNTVELKSDSKDMEETLPTEDEWLAQLASKQDEGEAAIPQASLLDSVIDASQEASTPTRAASASATAASPPRPAASGSGGAAGGRATGGGRGNVEKDPKLIADFFHSLLKGKGNRTRGSAPAGASGAAAARRRPPADT